MLVDDDLVADATVDEVLLIDQLVDSMDEVELLRLLSLTDVHIVQIEDVRIVAKNHLQQIWMEL